MTTRATTWFNPGLLIVVSVAGLCAIGFTILFSASVLAQSNPYHYVSRQAVAATLAVFAGLIVSRIDLDWARQWTWWIALAVVAGLVLTIIPGIGLQIKGSRRWLDFGPLNLQVSEFAKLAVVLVLAHYLAANQSRISSLARGFLYPLGLIGVGSGLIILQPDYGTAAMVGAVGITLLFLAGARWRYLIPGALLVLSGFAYKVWQNPNRLNRILAFLDIEAHKDAGAYQLHQAILAFGAGGVGGVGLGHGRQQLAFLPEAHNDFIFAIVGEELGLGFTLLVVALFALIFIAGLVHLRRAPNLYHYLLVAGCLLIIAFQALINLAVVTGLFPTKGMSLPLVSYGGSNLLLMGLIVGLLLNTQRAWSQPAWRPTGRDLGEVPT